MCVCVHFLTQFGGRDEVTQLRYNPNNFTPTDRTNCDDWHENSNREEGCKSGEKARQEIGENKTKKENEIEEGSEGECKQKANKEREKKNGQEGKGKELK